MRVTFFFLASAPGHERRSSNTSEQAVVVIRLSEELLQWIQLDITVKDFRAFRLKENFTAVRKGIGAFIRQLAVDVLLYMAVLVHQFEDIPLTVRLFDFVYRVAVNLRHSSTGLC
jgi:hypothetical protein